MNYILLGLGFEFKEPKITKEEFKKTKDAAWELSLKNVNEAREIEQLRFYGLGKKNLSGDMARKLKPFCSSIPSQLDPFESVVDMAHREEQKKKGVTKKRNF